MKCQRIVELEDVLLIEYKEDYLFNAEIIKKLTGYYLVQENEVFSKRNVLRGIGFQLNHPQGKLLRVVQGEIYDVIVDMRSESPSFQKWKSFVLSSNDNKWLWIPPGYAHGYLVLSENALVSFKCTDYYYSDDEVGFIWNDKNLNIDWPVKSTEIVISKKDNNFSDFRECVEYVKREKK